MHIIDSHFHWYPRPVFEKLCQSPGYPRAERNGKGYRYWRRHSALPQLSPWPEWFDLEDQLAHMDGLGHDVDVISSIGPFSIYFSELSRAAGRDAALFWNEEMAAAQRKFAGRVWATAAIPLVDTQTAIEVLDDAILRLGLVGVNLPGSIGDDARIDAERLEPFYHRVEQLGVPLFLHPTDAIFEALLEGYGGALHLSLGRVIEVSAAAMRLLPYQSGRMDKNGTAAKLPSNPSTYLRRMYTDTVTPHSEGMKFAIDYYGVDHVMYGTDYPCWSPAAALDYLDAIEGLSAEDRQKIMHDNAVRVFKLDRPSFAQAAE
jgi:aminocarboxymuconate-semialdehyde decarboxylase